MINTKKKSILEILEKSEEDLSIGEIAKLSKMSRTTASKYLHILEAERKIKSRRVGRAILFRIKR